MNAKQLLGILAARWWVVLLVFVVTVAATAAITLLLPKTYTASTSLVLEPKFTDALGATNVGQTAVAQSYMATQIDIMQSQRVAARVVKNLALGDNATALKQFQEATNGVGSIEDYFANLLLKRLEVRPSRESTVVTISFAANDPRFAAQVADAFAQAYVDTTLDVRVAPAKQYATWFNEQLKNLRLELERAQTRLSAFQQRNGIVGNDERLDVENARLAELSSQLVVAQSQAVDARSRSSQGSPLVSSLPEVSSTPILAALRSDLLRSEAKLQELSMQLGPAHPTYERQLGETQSLRDRLATELSNSSGAVASSSRAMSQRESELRAAVGKQKNRVLEIKRLRDEMAVLGREAESAQKVFEVALQRFAQSNLESQTTQSSAYILNQAPIPTSPSSPRTTLNIILSAVLGFLLGIAAAILLELSDRRVRSASDLASVSKLQVLGNLGRSRRIGMKPLRLRWRGPARLARMSAGS